MKRFLLAAAARAPIRQALKEKPRSKPQWFYAGRGYGKSELAKVANNLARERGAVLTRNGSVITFT